MRPIYLILFLLLPFVSLAGTFVVTTTADSGPGSLRWAIQSANSNGTAVPDVIQFNLPLVSFFDHVILLESELPALTSNITIDGSTQPGEPFKITTTKVAVKFDKYAPTFTMFKINNATNIKIYGLYVYVGYDNFFDNTKPIRSNFLYGITISNSSNIEIGAPGKSNIINGAIYGILSESGNTSNIRIRSNFIGLGGYYDPPVGLGVGTDISDLVFPCEFGIKLLNATNIVIGGPSAEDGNVITCGKGITIESDKETGNGTVLVQNNFFQKWYDKVFDIGVTYANPNTLTFRTLLPWDRGSDIEVLFLDNFVNALVSLWGLTKPFSIKRNHFDVPHDARRYEKIMVSYCRGGGEIGGDALSDRNRFTNRWQTGGEAIRAYDNGPIRILKNQFNCNASWRSVTHVEHWNSSLVPYVQVDQTTSIMVAGRSAPNARIDLYYDDLCTACEGEEYIATITADGSGKWKYTGSITRPVVATATTATGYTGKFSEPMFNISNKKVVQPSCGLNNGSITGIKGEGAEYYYWLNLRTGDTVGRSLDLTNAGPGEYVLYGLHGDACVGSIYDAITLSEPSPEINTAFVSIAQPSCGKFNGAIGNLSFSSYFSHKWVNDIYEVISRSAEVSKLGPGKYSLIVYHENTPTCADTATFELVNQSGPSLDFSSMEITPATCFNADGKIVGIKSINHMGYESVSWEDSSGRVVGNGFDLINVPAGNYRAKYKDRTACDTIVTPYYTVPSPALGFIAPTYVEIKDALCGKNVGAVVIQSFDKDPSDYSFKWFDDNSNLVASSASVYNLKAGNYQLVASDKNGCSKTLIATDIKVEGGITIDKRSMKVLHDQCDRELASVSGLIVSGVSGNAVYTWYDAAGAKRGGEQVLELVGSGTYRLEVKDDKGCMAEIRDVVISNFDAAMPLPAYDDIFVPRNNKAVLKPKQTDVVLYQFFTDASGSNLVAENTTGVLETPAVSVSTAYYVRTRLGSCVSAMVRVLITPVDNSFFTIPTAFTPNRDGLNDYLEVRFFGRIDVEYFRVFNRYGQVVFSATKEGAKWDGKIAGKEAAPGVYVWSAKGRDLLGNIISGSGSFTLIR